VLVQRVKAVAPVLIVPDISIALSSYHTDQRPEERERRGGLNEEKNVIAAPERHHDAR
jgi:hypothetical protein